MTGTVTIVIDDLDCERTLRHAEHREWLTRSTLSLDRDAPLHRARVDVPCVRQAAGRWQVHYAKPSSKNMVRVVRHDSQPIDVGDRAAVIERLLGSAADVFGQGRDRQCEFDLHNGSWIVGVRATNGRWYLARLEVAGQPALLRGWLTAPEGEPTWDEGTAWHRASRATAGSGWPPPEGANDEHRVENWLNGHRAWSSPVSRRWAFGYLYQQYLLEETSAPREEAVGEVTRALQLNGDTLSTWRRSLRELIWGNQHSDADDLRRYLLEKELLTATDAREALSYVVALARGGKAVDAGRRVTDYRAARREKMEGPSHPG